MRKLRVLLMGLAALGCIGVAPESAHAQSFAFGVGATSPQFVFRQLFDCLYNQVPGGPAPLPGPYPLSPACWAGAGGSNQSQMGGEILYAPTGSGNGKAVLLSNDPATIGDPCSFNYLVAGSYYNSPYYGDGESCYGVPFTDPSIGVNSPSGYRYPRSPGDQYVGGYDGVQFIGSEDPVNAADVANWSAAGNPAKFGNLIQIPAVVGAVALGFNGKDGAGNPLAPTVCFYTYCQSGSSGLNLSRNALCGIVSGHITLWDNPILTALNTATPGTGGTTPYGHGNITFVHLLDGDGSTFLLSNALATQCQFEIGPNSETDATIVSYAMPWTDHAAACPFPIAHGASQLNWPEPGLSPTDQCGNAVTNPGGGHFASASATAGGLVPLVASINGAIGYASPSFWLPFRTGYGAMATANIQSQWDIISGNGQFEPPTFQGAYIAMESATPVFNDTTRPNPLAWSLQGVVPNPVVPGSYPISGFTWFEMYQCYRPHANQNNALRWFLYGLNFVYGSSQSAFPIMNVDGYANVPGNWEIEIYELINNPVYGVNYAGTGSCASIPLGAY
jgi:phosphate transport system substrate-binding protein